MEKILSFRRPIGVAAASLLAVAAIATTAYSATDTIYKYSTPKVGVYAISALAWAPDEGGTPYTTSHLGKLTGDGCFTAGVTLPQGAVVTNLAVTYSSGNDVFSAAVYRYNFATGAAEEIVSVLPEDLSGVRRTAKANAVASRAIVNNNQFSYGATMCLSPSDEFYGVRVGYTYTNAGD